MESTFAIEFPNQEEVVKDAIVYEIRNTVNNNIYIGSTTNPGRRWLDHKKHLRNNVHHCKYLQNAWNKYGEQSFEFITIESFTGNVKQILEREQHYIDSKHPEYNVCQKAQSVLGIKRSKETREKMSRAKKGQVVTQEWRDKISQTLKSMNLSGWKHSSDALSKMSETHKGKVTSEETKLKISQSKSGVPMSQDNKDAIRKAALNRRHPESVKEKIRQSLKGKPLSEETKEKMRAASALRWSRQEEHDKVSKSLRKYQETLQQVVA